MKEKKKVLEADLYKPIQQYFIKEGYTVYGEVKDCDVTAVKEDQLVVIELKLSLNVELLLQATKRQRLTEFVYIAIPKPTYSLKTKRWTDICYLVRRLELGLMVVSFSKTRRKAELIFHPAPFDRSKSMRQNKRKREAILTEISGRSADYNIGGTNRKKIMTAYKENCIHIACCLDQCGPLSPKALTEMGTGGKTSSILTKNYYSWFRRIKRGMYELSEKGKEEIKEYPELVHYYIDKIKKLDTNKEEKRDSD